MTAALLAVPQVRDLLAGTGAATEAYSVIEQGKVDIVIDIGTKNAHCGNDRNASSKRPGLQSNL